MVRAVVRQNLISFDARTYQAYYLAGVAAGTKERDASPRDYRSSTYSPPVIACVNAFALGAQKVNPATIVEVKWMEAPHDMDPGSPKREQTFTQELIANGADVITHTLDNNAPLAAIAGIQPQGVLGIGANLNDSCQIHPNRCLGATYYNWGPLFTRLLDEVHKQTLDDYGRVLEGIQVNPADSGVIGFAVSDQIIGAAALKQTIPTSLQELASDNGVGRVFAGPPTLTQCETQTMQTPCVDNGLHAQRRRLERDVLARRYRGSLHGYGRTSSHPADAGLRADDELNGSEKGKALLPLRLRRGTGAPRSRIRNQPVRIRRREQRRVVGQAGEEALRVRCVLETLEAVHEERDAALHGALRAAEIADVDAGIVQRQVNGGFVEEAGAPPSRSVAASVASSIACSASPRRRAASAQKPRATGRTSRFIVAR